MRVRQQPGVRSSFLREMLPPEEQAIEAVVSRYQAVAPAVTRFARSLADNPKLRVVLGPAAAVTNDEVVCDPRLFQAATNRAAPVTAPEMALASAMHEVVHLLSTNFDEPFGPDETNGALNGEEDLLDFLAREGGPVAEILFFNLEDARQEVQGLVNYPGVRSVLTDLYLSALSFAISKSGPLGQFTLGCFLYCGSYIEREALERRLNSRAQQALADAYPICVKAGNETDPREVAKHALALHEIARAHGLLTSVREEGTQAQKRMVQKVDAEAAADGADMVRLPSPVLRNTESYRDVQRAAEARAGVSDRKGASELAGDASTDQLLRVSEAPTVYLPTGMGGKLVVTAAPTTFADLPAMAGRRWPRRPESGVSPSARFRVSSTRSSPPTSGGDCGPATTRATFPLMPPSSSVPVSTTACMNDGPHGPDVRMR